MFTDDELTKLLNAANILRAHECYTASSIVMESVKRLAGDTQTGVRSREPVDRDKVWRDAVAKRAEERRIKAEVCTSRPLKDATWQPWQEPVPAAPDAEGDDDGPAAFQGGPEAWFTREIEGAGTAVALAVIVRHINIAYVDNVIDGWVRRRLIARNQERVAELRAE